MFNIINILILRYIIVCVKKYKDGYLIDVRNAIGQFLLRLENGLVL